MKTKFKASVGTDGKRQRGLELGPLTPNSEPVVRRSASASSPFLILSRGSLQRLNRPDSESVKNDNFRRTSLLPVKSAGAYLVHFRCTFGAQMVHFWSNSGCRVGRFTAYLRCCGKRQEPVSAFIRVDSSSFVVGKSGGDQ
jgi:hypothetical protein